ncbi:MAG: transporter substrate-binding domain-containing protein [Deltaproteobacteria bacterium]|jgi:polar amino acid transport system substrate-binding protein|nr:transporter substrate-binding domain-containing protein [Deltaproteobacteria bacterium]
MRVILSLSVLVFSLTMAFVDSANLDKIYVVAVNKDYPPYVTINPETNEIEGLSVDITRAICDNLNINCQFTRLDYKDFFHDLEKNKVDIICYSSGLRMDISALFLSTNKFLSSASAFVGLKGAVKNFSPNELIGKRIGVVRKSPQDWYVGVNYQEFSEEREFEEFQEIMTALVLGEIDLGFVDIMAFYYYVQRDKGLDFDIYGPPVNLGDGGFLIIRNNQEKLLKDLNQAILTVRYSSQFEAINAKYFDFFIF